ncbi:MAG: 30S ribosome-binding factor RbfA [Blastocatellia bacterium]
MPSHRPQKMAEAMRLEISALISRELHDPRIGFTTVMEVKLSPDLRHARVWVSVMGSAEQQRQTMTALEDATGFIRRALWQRMRLRHSPALVFAMDETPAHADHMTRLLDEVVRELSPLPPADDDTGAAQTISPTDAPMQSPETINPIPPASVTAPRHSGSDSESA